MLVYQEGIYRTIKSPLVKSLITIIIIIKPLLTSLTVLVVFGNQTVQMTIHFKYL